MTGRTLYLTVALVVASVGLVAPGASASGPALRISPAVGPPTTRVRLWGRGFGPAETVDLAFDGSVRSTGHTDQDGEFTGRLGVPASARPGPHTISATGESSGLTSSRPYLVRTDWTRFEFDNANTGVNPYENVVGTSNVGNLALQWKAYLDSFVYNAVVVGGVVYGTGQTLGSIDGSVFALDASNGALRWSQPLASGPSGPATVAGGAVYVGSFDHAMHAYRASDGKVLWTTPTTGTPGVPVVNGRTLYAGVNNGVADAIDARTGSIVWTSSVGYSTAGGMALADGVLYLGTDDFKVHALDAATGAALWTATTNGSVISAPAVSGGVVYVGSTHFNLYAFDAGTGAKVWSAPTGAGITASPAVADGTVYVGSQDDVLYAFDAATGARLWAMPTAGAVTQSPIVANGVVYNGSNDFSMYAFAASTGSALWSYKTDQVIGEGALADGVLYVPSFDGYLYTFHLP